MKWLDRDLILAPFFCLCLSEEDFNEIHKELNCDRVKSGEWARSRGATTHFFTRDNDSLAVVAVDYEAIKDAALSEIYGLLVHEATHIWQDLLKDLGEKNPSSEFEAYSIQMISMRLMDSWDEQVKAMLTTTKDNNVS